MPSMLRCEQVPTQPLGIANSDKLKRAHSSKNARYGADDAIFFLPFSEVLK
jgi:hypothetical protein